uniref:Uncharacterized protein n=1 Tax=Klebsiella pneumoniae TaxID=573 RepID=A0A8B0SV25_KLEPN|nr:hypothetical protein [Klebsiella pneumoniae]
MLVLFTNLPYLSRQVKLVIFKYFNELKKVGMRSALEQQQGIARYQNSK